MIKLFKDKPLLNINKLTVFVKQRNWIQVLEIKTIFAHFIVAHQQTILKYQQLDSFCQKKEFNLSSGPKPSLRNSLLPIS